MRRPKLDPRCGLLLLGLVPGLLGADDVGHADGRWIEVTTSNFRLISNAEEEVTLAVVEHLEQFRAMATILTGLDRIEPTFPIRVFVFGDSDSWSRFVDRENVSGFFVNDMESNYIALDMSDSKDRGGMETVLHEYSHFLSRNRRSRVHQPTWYEEGFADAISTARVEDGKILVGHAPSGRETLLEEKTWLPLDRVLTARGYAGLSSEEMSMFYAQSWLLAHRLMWGHVAGFPARHEELIQYILRVGTTGASEEAAFEEITGASFEKTEKELRRYLRDGIPYVTLEEKPPEFSFEPRIRSLSPATVLVLLGELQLARGDQGAAEAEALARGALAADPESPHAMLLLAGALATQGDDRGAELTERASAIASDSPEIIRGVAHVAMLRLWKTDLAGPDRRAVAEAARDLYTRAVALAPESPAGHAGLGYAHLALNDPVKANASLQQAFVMARWNLNIVLALGELHSRYGRAEDAQKLLREVISFSHDEELRARAREILDAMDAPGRKAD